MGVGITIGNTVESAGPALQKGEFVGVSVPIGKSLSWLSLCRCSLFMYQPSVSSS
jgi:hypothetical protein